MTVPQIDDDKLQAYFDGELPEGETEEIQKALEASEEDQQRLAQLERLRDFVRLAAEDAPGEIDGDDLFAKVRAGIDTQEKAGFGKPFGVVEGEGRSAGGGRGAMIAASLALAAAILLAVWSPWANDEVAVKPPGKESFRPPKPQIMYAAGSEVVEVDFGGNTGTVFKVEGDEGEPIAVVWINEEGAP